ncbi:response regulator [Palleronia sp. KMU-117]|uniref:response regulator n=1 Tax=Palleronia sp. KMU-117 TaxID=3434108 RepID=UPI003D75AFE5
MSAPLILCIEDEPALRRDIADDLSEAGYRVLAACDGEQALACLVDERPDLILCDIVMPRLDGHAFLKRWRRERPDCADVPFVFLTALSSREQIIDGRRAGADDYVTKPIDYDLLRATIASRLDQIRRLQTNGADEGPSAIAALDGLGMGVVLLDPEMRVLHANHQARALAPSAGLCLRGRIWAKGGQGRDLRRMIAVLPGSAEGRPKGSAAMTLVAGDRRYHLVGRVLATDHRKGSASAMLLITTADQPVPIDEELLRQLFDLTPAEAAVARRVGTGLRKDEIAAELNISATTVAFHMRNIFAKTGSRRQADLVALLLSLPVTWAAREGG